MLKWGKKMFILDEIQLKMLLSHRVLWGLGELIWVKLLEQGLAQSKYYEMLAIMTWCGLIF